jgi:hypothetical protein
MLDSISQKALFADRAHFGKRTADGVWQKFFAEAGQGRRGGSAEEERGDSQIELIDQILFEERSE